MKNIKLTTFDNLKCALNIASIIGETGMFDMFLSIDYTKLTGYVPPTKWCSHSEDEGNSEHGEHTTDNKKRENSTDGDMVHDISENLLEGLGVLEGLGELVEMNAYVTESDEDEDESTCLIDRQHF